MNRIVLEPIRLVLDTNIVLDWLVFQDASLIELGPQIAAGRMIVLTHPLATCELARVLDYEQLRLSAERRADVLARYRAQSTVAAMPIGFETGAWRLPAMFPRCRDPDDDLFLALAHHADATALVTRDRALLKMRKRVRRFGMSIWGAQQLTDLLSEPATSREI